MTNLPPMTKPAATPVTDDKPAATPVTDDKPAANSDVENLASGDIQDQKSAHDFLASVTN